MGAALWRAGQARRCLGPGGCAAPWFVMHGLLSRMPAVGGERWECFHHLAVSRSDEVGLRIGREESRIGGSEGIVVLWEGRGVHVGEMRQWQSQVSAMTTMAVAGGCG